MSVTLMWTGLKQPKGTEKEIQEQKNLKNYLGHSISLMNQEDQEKIDSVTAAYAGKISKDTVEQASAQVRKEMKGYGLKTKLNERLNADGMERALKGTTTAQRLFAEAFVTIAPGFCTGVAVSVFNNDAGKVVGGAMLANDLLKTALRYAVVSSNEKEAADVKQYGELKRIDWALKKLKKEIKSQAKPAEARNVGLENMLSAKVAAAKAR
ncbi:MAG: hypothetical protein IJ752_04355 [Alphaproteobacteria bacterium]|nr:hypothetical protein [Alphaproteobacteria bacterium]